ncbi:hypothetical protein [Geothrix edaphica]|uniref:Uncharacterized protein n=1 Tax=Geothrix edaphica TaxID=2927976 RepID=A0ABQ5PXD4_9BACT|nr:hypothetical protein [Geothrix edaphica]GLH67132.1 hypothetical protein GETHED_14960 [Geothrix edaphica]
MMALALLVSRGGPPPPPFVFLLVPAVFLAISWFSNRLMGLPALYAAFPADPTDPIERSLGWPQVEFGALRGHSPISLKVGRRCLHLKQPFPFQPAWWQGPASIPWDQIRVEKAADESSWAFLSAAEFRLGADGRVIRLRGRAARTLQAKVREKQGHAGGPSCGTGLPPGPGAIRPR